MKLSPDRLLPPAHRCYYLHGEDQDALVEAAEALLAAGDAGALRLRVDVSELARIESESSNQGLFGPSACLALVRNVEAATPKQSEHLLRLARNVRDGDLLILCAPGIDWKKSIHKSLQAEQAIAQCEFHQPDERQFERWLSGEIERAGLKLQPESYERIAERLCGMRLAARQLIERLKLYDGGRGELLEWPVVAALLGERSPEALDEWCHAVAMREPRAIGLARRLLAEQQVAEVQMISWLGTRFQQLLLYRWFEARRDRNPLQAAKVFGEARKLVAGEARQWRGSELGAAVQRIVEAEKLVKGASVESKGVVMERLTFDLVQPGRLVA